MKAGNPGMGESREIKTGETVMNYIGIDIS